MNTGTSSPTFASIEPLHQNPFAVLEIGGGVVPEMAKAFGVSLAGGTTEEALGRLISAVGPAKTLQDNIAHAKEVLGLDAITISRDWAERSGLLVPVSRPYMRGVTEEGAGAVSPQSVDVAVITGGVRNWMHRRTEYLAESVESGTGVGRVILAGGNRAMGTAEGPDVQQGMREQDYLEAVVAPRLGELGLRTEVLAVPSASGNQVNAAVAGCLRPEDTVMYVGNAGQWVQGAGQLRRAARGVMPGFDADGSQLHVISDGFPLGDGTQPPAAAQHPVSALGIIARNAQELTRHML